MGRQYSKIGTKRRRRRRKTGKHYKTGIHVSVKCTNGPAKYRSGWELAVCKHLDDNSNVIEYQYEPFEIRYVSNQKTGRIRIYIPDFLVIYADGSKKLIEVKRTKHLNNPTVKKKAIVARAYASRNGMIYEFWCEPQIFPLMKEQKLKEKELQKALKEKLSNLKSI